LNGLKERDFFGLVDRLWMVGGESIDFGECGHGIEETVFNLRVCDIVRRRFENVEFVPRAGVGVRLIVEARHNVLNHFELGEQQPDRHLLIEGEVAFAAALGVNFQGFSEFIGHTQIIDNQAALFLKVNAVDAGDRLHQVVPLHRLVDIHRVKDGGIEPSEPHIADDDEFEVIGGVFEPLRQDLAIFLVGVVFYEVALIRSAGSHDDFNFAAVEVVTVPVGAEFDNGIVKVGSYLTAEGDDHAFAAIGSLADFKMGDDVVGDGC